jgi:flagellar biosynthesis chaperone FliJ
VERPPYATTGNLLKPHPVGFTGSQRHDIHVRDRYTANMSSGVSVDEFQALEQKVLRAVEIVRREREARAAAEAEVASLREQLAEQAKGAESQLHAALHEKESAEDQIAALNQERDSVRQRVEKMLQQMDELL